MMGEKHKHAEIIKAWADGAEIEIKYLPNGDWHTPDVISWLDGAEYRIKPEPPKYPKYRGSPDMLSNAAGISWDSENDALMFFREGIDKAFFKVAHHAIEQSIHDGDVVPAAMLERVAEAVRSELVAQVARYSTGCSTYINGETDLAAIIAKVKEDK